MSLTRVTCYVTPLYAIQFKCGLNCGEGQEAPHPLFGASPSQGVVQQDIKPANIMITSGDLAKVTDIGIAKFRATQASQSGAVWGSPYDMSPEQIQGTAMDGRSDIFSLGVVMYEMLTRERPFLGESVPTVSYRVLNMEPISPSELVPAIPSSLSSVITRALEKNPADRYQTCQALAQALRSCVSLGGTNEISETKALSVSPMRVAARPAALYGPTDAGFGKRNKDWNYWKDGRVYDNEALGRAHNALAGDRGRSGCRKSRRRTPAGDGE